MSLYAKTYHNKNEYRGSYKQWNHSSLPEPVILISGILAGLLCLIGGSIWLLHSKRKRKVNVSVGPVATEEVKDRLVEEEPTEQKVSLVLLLGGFQIFDKQGDNITGDFTPTLKQVLYYEWS
jgi:hypothetical protein